MSELRLIEAVKSDDLGAARELIESGANVNQQDEHGWTPLCWAAGKGSTSLLQLLIESGGDIYKVGKDQRTPYDIALGAGHVEAVKLLLQAAQKSGRSLDDNGRRYCRAYPLSELRRFPQWSESKINLTNPEPQTATDGADARGLSDIVFLHQDFTVTLSMWQGENIIFNEVTADWQEFCVRELGFKVPGDLDLISRASA
jgi:ankyrin repeat protein